MDDKRPKIKGHKKLLITSCPAFVAKLFFNFYFACDFFNNVAYKTEFLKCCKCISKVRNFSLITLK